MDAVARRRRLFEKATANHQRREQEELLNRLPPSLSSVLSESPCIYSTEIDPILRRFLPFTRSGVGSKAVVPPRYQFAEVAWESKMLSLLPRLVVPEIAGKAFLLLKAPSDVRFEEQCFYLPDVPLFVVDFQWAAPLLAELWSYCTGGLFLVEQALQAGVLIDSYVGHLPDDWNPNEIFYEIALWPAELKG